MMYKLEKIMLELMNDMLKVGELSEVSSLKVTTPYDYEGLKVVDFLLEIKDGVDIQSLADKIKKIYDETGDSYLDKNAQKLAREMNEEVIAMKQNYKLLSKMINEKKPR